MPFGESGFPIRDPFAFVATDHTGRDGREGSHGFPVRTGSQVGMHRSPILPDRKRVMKVLKCPRVSKQQAVSCADLAKGTSGMPVEPRKVDQGLKSQPSDRNVDHICNTQRLLIRFTSFRQLPFLTAAGAE